MPGPRTHTGNPGTVKVSVTMPDALHKEFITLCKKMGKSGNATMLDALRALIALESRDLPIHAPMSNLRR